MPCVIITIIVHLFSWTSPPSRNYQQAKLKNFHSSQICLPIVLAILIKSSTAYRENKSNCCGYRRPRILCPDIGANVSWPSRDADLHAFCKAKNCWPQIYIYNHILSLYYRRVEPFRWLKIEDASHAFQISFMPRPVIMSNVSVWTWLAVFVDQRIAFCNLSSMSDLNWGKWYKLYFEVFCS